ncbi:MAG: DUF3107 domain-containing protein [Brachybacterium sp.]|nr:DUF3107 domain-containing protein [Brachybacterium sp.]
MEIRIGVQHSPREIVVETDQTTDSVLESLQSAMSSGEPVRLTDSKGRVVLVTGSKIAYAEVATEEPRRVGFLG